MHLEGIATTVVSIEERHIIERGCQLLKQGDNFKYLEVEIRKDGISKLNRKLKQLTQRF